MNLFPKFAQGLSYQDFLGRYANDSQKMRWQQVHDHVTLTSAQRDLLRSSSLQERQKRFYDREGHDAQPAQSGDSERRTELPRHEILKWAPDSWCQEPLVRRWIEALPIERSLLGR